MTTIWIEDPYAPAKGRLLAAVGATNRVRVVWDGDYGYMNVVGFVSELDAVEMVFMSLLVQASHSMLTKGRVVDERGRREPVPSASRSTWLSLVVSSRGCGVGDSGPKT